MTFLGLAFHFISLESACGVSRSVDSIMPLRGTTVFLIMHHAFNLHFSLYAVSAVPQVLGSIQILQGLVAVLSYVIGDCN